VYSGLLKT